MQISPELTGLSSQEVASRVQQGLANAQEFGKSRSILTILRANLLTLFNAVVGGSFLVLLILGYWKDALFGIAVITNVLIGVIQEYRSKRILDKLTILSKSPVQVRRAGRTELIAIQEVVLDDLIEIKSGDQLSADVVVISTNGLELDESPLTGEAEPVSRAAGEELLSGSIVTSGSALVKAIRVGANTYSSKLVSEARVFSKVSSEIRRALDRVIVWISWALGPVIAVVVYGQLQATPQWEDAVVSSVASVISMVPQGLVLIVSIAFAIAATRLAKRQVLLQELAAVEGLARVDIVCIDKTGTLTGSAMQLDQVIELPAANSYGQWKAILGEFAHLPSGSSTTKALQETFPASRLTIEKEVEFTSTTKFSSISVSGINWVLGAPEVISTDKELLSQVSELASTGSRTLLLAAGKDIRPLVLLTFREEIRPEARDTLAYLRAQGVKVRVLSGDHPETVAGVARSVGLDFDGVGFDARELSTDIDELAKAMEEHSVFGRVTPEQKKLMVTALQKQGHVVAMIGDGVNDALALKQSDLGIAMGSGSAATRAVANLVLLDNRFASLPEIVSEGRRVIANVERLSRLFLTKTVWAMMLAVVFGLTLWEFPFLPRQLSAVDGFTIGIPAFLLAFLPNSQRYQPGFLKRALLFCVPAGLVTALGVIVLSIIMRDSSWTQVESQTATAMLLSITGLWVLSSLDRPTNKIKLGILLVMFLLAFALFYLPLTIEFFGLTQLGLDQLLPVVGLGAVVGASLELIRFMAGRPPRTR